MWETWRSKGYLALAERYNKQKAVYEQVAEEIGVNLRARPNLPLDYAEGIALLNEMDRSA